MRKGTFYKKFKITRIVQKYFSKSGKPNRATFSTWQKKISCVPVIHTIHIFIIVLCAHTTLKVEFLVQNVSFYTTLIWIFTLKLDNILEYLILKIKNIFSICFKFPTKQKSLNFRSKNQVILHKKLFCWPILGS